MGVGESTGLSWVPAQCSAHGRLSFLNVKKSEPGEVSRSKTWGGDGEDTQTQGVELGRNVVRFVLPKSPPGEQKGQRLAGLSDKNELQFGLAPELV